MKIYTRTGDDGSTGLIGGRRVRKSDPRLDCYGTVDELNATLGWAAVVAPDATATLLGTIQHELFNIGSHLAVPDDAGVAVRDMLPPLPDAMVARLEREIDEAEKSLPALRNFILPGGSEAAARLHVARTVCRRAERALVAFGDAHDVPAVVVTYLNRLSDWCFVQARRANQHAGVTDVAWRK